MTSYRIHARYLFDGLNAPIQHGGIVVEGDRIVAAGPAASLPRREADEVVELGDVAILPGLIDAHIHLAGTRSHGDAFPDPALDALRAADDARKVLQSGFTTVRDCGSSVAIALRRAIAEGTTVGPRILAAGPVLSQTGGHGDWHALPYELLDRLAGQALIVDGVDACRRGVRRAIRDGADLIKICTTGGVGSERDHPNDEHLTVDEIRAIVEEAHRAGRPVAAHAQGKAGVLNAVRAGVDSIEHGYFVDEECIDEMLARGTALVPTFGLIEFFRRSDDGRFELPEWRLAKQRECAAAMARSFPLAAASGVPIATGSDDYGAPGRELGRSAEELVAMVRTGGAAALDVLRWASSGGARVLRLDAEVGRLEAGKAADVIAVRGLPWDDIEAVRDVAFVMQGGRMVVGPEPAAAGSAARAA